VIQHQYWDLEVHDGHFEIVLKFNRVPQHLSIPYVAMTRFVDPAVNFGVSFEKAGSDTDSTVVAPALEQDGVDNGDAATEKDGEGDTVISLDAFRRK
ncbi:MAG: ClpXP protease specificity-enhancing factor SspB, partial [Pseudomonadota bacterium]